MSIETTTLESSRVRLEPLAQAHRDGLAAAIRDGELWKLNVTLVPSPEELDGFYARADAELANGRELTFVTIDKATNSIAGSTRFLNIDLANARAEIGFTFIGSTWQRTHINTEAKCLMLTYAFEYWRCNRVELITDLLNTASRNAIARIGATQEGVLRNHMVMRDGRIRDSVLFSIIASEWPTVRHALKLKLQG